MVESYCSSARGDFTKSSLPTYFWIWVVEEYCFFNVHCFFFQVIRIERGITVRELSDYIHKVFARYSHQYMGLYLHDEFHSGHWLNDQETQTIEYYSLQNMDIIELKETAVYKVRPLDQEESITCSRDTLVRDLIKMIICWISSPVDDPTRVGLVFHRKNAEKNLEPVWLDPLTPFGQYELVETERFHLMSVYQQESSQLIATLVIHSDPSSSSVSRSLL